MASLNTRGDGTRSIQFTDPAGKRRTITVGKLPKKAAEELTAKVGHLASLQKAGLPVDPETAAWVAKLSAGYAAKLAAVGLVPGRRSATLGGFLADYLAGRRADAKGTTIVNINQACVDLLGHFGDAADVRSVTPAAADAFRRHYPARGLAPTTVARRLKNCRLVFAAAVARGLVDANPFAGVKGPAATPNPDRQVYVSRPDIRRVLAACSPEWQVIVALARFAGLRAPSEVFSLRWADIDLPAGRMVVRSPKTERHAGGASREVPIFPDLRPYLEDAFERVESGAEFVVGGVGERGRARMRASPNGWNAVNLCVPLGKMIERAGLSVWPKTVHNLRASCETDLAAAHPLHVVCKWIGNTPKVALGHYLQTLDADFAKALAATPTAGGGAAESAASLLQNPLPSHTCQNVPEPSRRAKMPEILDSGRFLTAEDGSGRGSGLGRVGVEPTSNSL